MDRKYYGPNVETRVAINELLSLPATGMEQDWEIELADPARLEEFIVVLNDPNLTLGQRSAVAMLVVGSVDAAECQNCLSASLFNRARAAIRKNSQVFERMRFYWLEAHDYSDEFCFRRLLQG